jgi:hypothetical protein
MSEIRRYPDGRLGDDDMGETEMDVGLSPIDEPRAIVLRFPTPTKWVGMDADLARQLAAMLCELADKLDRGE